MKDFLYGLFAEFLIGFTILQLLPDSVWKWVIFAAVSVGAAKLDVDEILSWIK